MQYVQLSNDVIMPKVILGSFNISDQSMIDNMVKAAFGEGVTGFDTSPSYGSEKILGNALKNNGIDRKKIFLSDKIDAWQMYEGNGSIDCYVEKSLKDLSTDYLDLLLVHWPLKKYLYKTWKSFESLYNEGRVRSIGLCNVDKRTFNEFLESGIQVRPHVVQIEISPLRTANADLEAFHKAGIVIEAYSPLCRMIPEIKDSEILQSLSKKYNKSIPQIILKWHLQRNIVPVFTSSKPQRIKENIDIFQFMMEQEDVDRITSMNSNYKIFPESFGCPGY